MSKGIYSAHTNTYKVENADGSFDTYTPAQYAEKFGAVPAPVEDVTDLGLEKELKTGSDVEPGVPDTVETVTSTDGEVTVPVSDIEEGVKNFGELTEEEKEVVLKELEEAKAKETEVLTETFDVPEQTGQISTDASVLVGDMVNSDYSGPVTSDLNTQA
jgi:hypothetical protein